VLGHFQDQVIGLVVNGRIGDQKGASNFRQLSLGKGHVYNRADDLDDFTLVHFLDTSNLQKEA
jgi:hypothetical protein